MCVSGTIDWLMLDFARVSIRSLQQKDVVAASEKAGIIVTAYSPLGSDASPLLSNEVITKIASKYEVEPASILISYHANQPGRTGKFPCNHP